MELQLVYRFLRKVSDWAVTGYYSEVLVEGQENILNIQDDGGTSVNGPVILCASHHNEMIDIATLAMTMPKRQGERRHVSFWAKESMFKNPVGGWVMRSSEAIPVKRNPNRSDSGVSGRNDNGGGSLFASTSHALSLDKVVGIFPEGTSYTQPGIVQVMPGAARAAVEYELWRYENRRDTDGGIPGRDVVIIPVGIVYTDKTKYQSRVKVRYGTPIRLEEYWEEHDDPSSSESASSGVDSSRAGTVTKAVAARIEQALFGLTINAPDWETLYAAQVARDVIFEDEEIPLQKWIPVSQRLIDLFTPTASSSEPLDHARRALTRYYALLHHTGLSHSVLKALYPLAVSSLPSKPGPTPMAILHRKDISKWTKEDWKSYHLATFRFHVSHAGSLSILKNIAHTIAIIPILPLYVPAFVVSHLTARFLATPGEDEGEAQFRSVGGGVGLGLGLVLGKVVSGEIWRRGYASRAIEILLSRFGPVLDGIRVSFDHWVDTLEVTTRNVWQSNFAAMGTIRWAVEQVSNSLKILKSNEASDLVSNFLASDAVATTAGGVLKGTGWLLLAWGIVKWHGLFIRRAHTAYIHTLAPSARGLWLHHLRVLFWVNSWNSPSGDNQPKSHLFEDSELSPYLTLPPPPSNAFIRQKAHSNEPGSSNASAILDPGLLSSTEKSDLVQKPQEKLRPIPPSKLLAALLCAREEATSAIYSLNGVSDTVKAL
ncbi:hypothetical protein GYMLUDRAFT_39847 [Collybiopsis luxurians FD-317 M1]|nr:hypothetical protein GYMLUDRAFT_39847 [Collybiopsis luxurians FD-317 M1]